MSRVKDMTSGNPTKLILTFAFPLLFANIGQQFYTIVDAAIVGRGVGIKALAAVGATDWVYWMVLWGMAALIQGFSTFISRYFGEKNFDKLNMAIANSTLLCIICSIFVTVIGLLFGKAVLEFLDTPPDILSDATIYLYTLLCGLIIVSGYNMASSILRAFGDSKTPLIAMIVAALTNVVLDLIFVLVFHWGIFGAAFATVIAQFISLIYCLIRITKIEYISFKKNYWSPNIKMMKEFLFFSLPLAFQAVLVSIGGMVVQSVINIQGSIFVAGYTASNKLYGLLESSAVSIGHAVTTYTAQNYGANNIERIKMGVKSSVKIAIIASLTVSAFAFIFGKFFLQVFIDAKGSEALRALDVAHTYLFWMAVFLSALYLIYVYRNTLQSLGNSYWTLLSGFMELVARVIAVKVLIIWLDINVLYFVEPLAWIASFLSVMIPYFFKVKQLQSQKTGQ